MSMTKTLRTIAAAVGALAPALLGHAAQPDAEPAAEPKYMRVADENDGATVALELSVRTLTPTEGDGPVVHLVGVAHIAQPAYYRALQRFLDEQDLVLFEGVGPPWMNVPEDADDDRRRAATDGRIRFVAAAAEGVRRKLGEYPADAAALMELAEPSSRRQIRDALTDAWGRPLVYDATGGELELSSLGADGRPGGEGAGADALWSEQAPLADAEIAPSDGLQSQLADAAGLVFQLDSIDYMRDDWINSDMTVDELLGVTGDGLAGEDGEADPLMGLLSGESFMAKAVGLVLKLVGSSEYSRAILRLTLIEMLGRSEDLMEMAVPAMGEGIWERILDGRNEVVLDDLRAVLDEPGDVRSVAVFYGSGHLPGLESALIDQDGYAVSETTWLPAIVVDFDSSGIPPEQGEFFRGTVSSMLERQIEMAKRMAEIQR